MLKYPGDLAENSADWVQFEFYQYKPPYSGDSSAKKNNSSNYVYQYNASTDTGKGTILAKAGGVYENIALYMPEDISSSYQGTWGGRQFGPLAPIALAGAGGILNATDPDQIIPAGQQMGNQIGGMIMGAIPYVGASTVASLMNRLPGFGGGVQPNDILASTRGQILNPNTEVLYQGPELRTFSLNFKMFARSQAESEIIKKICTIFKKAMLPSGGSDTEKNLINVPKIVKVTFMHEGKPHEWVSQFKTCGIGGVDINYTPDGSWSTYRTGAPVAVQLTLQFQELKLIYENDIDAGY
jgi:hypothetical protein